MATGTSRTVKYNSTSVGSYHQSSTISIANAANCTITVKAIRRTSSGSIESTAGGTVSPTYTTLTNKNSVITWDINAVCTVLSSISAAKNYPFTGSISWTKAGTSQTAISYTGSTGSMNPGTSAVTKDIATKTATVAKTTSSQAISATISMNINTSGNYSGSGNSSVSLSGTVPALSNNSVTLVATPASDVGYVFLGWATSPTATTYVSTSTSYTVSDVTASATYYGIFTSTRKVYFSSGINEEQRDEVEQICGDGTYRPITLPTAKTISGWTFIGWHHTTDATSSPTYGSNVTTATPTTYETFYAVYSRTLTLSYTNGGGSGTGPSNQTSTQYYNSYRTITSGSFTLAANTFTRTGYNFNGWAAGSAGATYTWTPGVSSSASTSTAAQWAEHTATLTYANGGHGTAPSAVTMRYTTATTAASAISASGYTFTGWKRSDNNTIIQPGATVKAANVEPAALTLTAQWTTNMTVTPTAYSGNYDGAAHSASIKVNVAGTTVEYGTSTSYGYSLTATNADTNYTMSSITRTDVGNSSGLSGTTTVYYRVTKSGYTTVTGTTSITINRVSVGAKPTTSVSKTYTGGSQSNGYTTPTGVTKSGNDSGTAVGTYTATYTPDGNHKWSDNTYAAVSVTLTIGNANLTVSAPNQSYTYNGSAQGSAITVTSVGSQTVTIKYGTTNGTYNLTSAPQITNVADSKTIYYQATAANHNTATGSYTLTINKRTVTPTAPTLTTGTLTYNGSPKTLANAGSCTAGGTMYYYVGTSSTAPTFSTSTYSTSISTKTDAGTYYIFWYCYVSDTANNNDTTSDNINVVKSLGSRVIGQADNPIAVTATQSTSANYNVSNQDKSFTAATGAQGTVTYAIQSQKNSGGTTVTSFSIPTNTTASLRVAALTTASTYTVVVRATAAGNSNYKSGYKDITITVTVTSYTVTMTKGTGISSVTYKLGTGSATTYSSAVTVPVGQTVTYGATVSSGYTWWKWTGTHTSTTNAYSFTMSASNVSDTANAMQQITTPSWKGTLTYSGSSQSATTTTLWNNYSTSTSTIGGTTSGTNATSYNATFTPKSGYCWTDGTTSAKTVSWSIGTKPITITGASASKTYDRTALTSNSASLTSGSLVSGHTATYSASGTITNVGSTNNIPSVVIKSGSTDVTSNYGVTKVNGTLTITAKEVTLTWGTTSWTYDKSTHSTTCTVGGIISGDTCTVTLTGNSVGASVGTATVTASSLSNSNYKLPSAKTATLSVTQREVTLTWGTTSWTYDGNTHSTTCTAGNLVSGDTCTVTLTGNSVGANVGSATVTASSLSNSNYKLPSANTKTISITAAGSSFTLSPTTLTLTYPTAGTSTFSGTNCSINGVSSSNTNVATVSKSGNTITVTPQAVGTATITVTGTAASTNYSAPANKTISVTVNRGTQTVNLSATSGTITYPATTLTFTASTTGNGALSVSPTSGNSVANASISNGTVTVTKAGYGTVTITVTAAQTNQYNSASKTYSVTVAKAAGTLTLTAKTGLVYTGSSQTLTTYSGNSGTVTYDTTYVNSGTNAGTYTVKATSAESTNYYAVTKQVNVTISTANQAPTVTAIANLKYTGSAQTLATLGGTHPGTMHYRLGTSGSWSTTIPTATNANSYTVYWYADAVTNSASSTTNYTKATNNYNAYSSSSSPSSTVCNIGKATNPMTWPSGSTITKGYANALSTTINAVSNAQGTVTYSLTSQVNSSNIAVTYFSFNTSTRVLSAAASTATLDTYTIKITAVAAGNDNYESKTLVHTVTIPVVRTSVGAKPTTTSVSKLYSMAEQTNNYTTPSNVTMTGSNKGTTVGTYTATYTPNYGYKWSDDTYGAVTVTLTIWAPCVYVKQSNTWKQSIPIIKVNGAWKVPNAVYVNVNGTWKQVIKM